MNLKSTTLLIIIISVSIILSINVVFAIDDNPYNYIGRIVIRDDNNHIIEFQSGLSPLGTLTQNAINGGFTAEQVTEMYVNESTLNYYLEISKPPPKEVTQTYTNAINDLNTIINYSSPTNAQVVWAIKRIAEIERTELRYHRSEYDFE